MTSCRHLYSLKAVYSTFRNIGTVLETVPYTLHSALHKGDIVVVVTSCSPWLQLDWSAFKAFRPFCVHVSRDLRTGVCVYGKA